MAQIKKSYPNFVTGGIVTPSTPIPRAKKPISVGTVITQPAEPEKFRQGMKAGTFQETPVTPIIKDYPNFVTGGMVTQQPPQQQKYTPEQELAAKNVNMPVQPTIQGLGSAGVTFLSTTPTQRSGIHNTGQPRYFINNKGVFQETTAQDLTNAGIDINAIPKDPDPDNLQGNTALRGAIGGSLQGNAGVIQDIFTNALRSIPQRNGQPIEDFTRKIDETISGQQATQGTQGTQGTQAGQPPQPPTPPQPIQTSDQARAKTRAEGIAAQKAELTPTAPQPTLFQSSAEFERLRKEQGIVQDEGELNALRNEMMQGQQELRQFRSTAGQGVTEAGRLGAVSEAERNLNFRLEGLAIREQAVLNRVNTKNSYINQSIQFGLQDYNTALNKWNSEYQQNVKATELYNQGLNDQQKDAMTAFTTMTNLLKEQKITSDKFTPAIESQLETMALQAGLPPDIFKTVFTQLPDEEKILSPITVDNETGGKDIYFFTQDSKGVPSLKQVQSITGAGKEEEHSPIYKEWRDASRSGYKGGFIQYQNEDANRKARASASTSSSELKELNLAMKQLQFEQLVRDQKSLNDRDLSALDRTEEAKSLNTLGDLRTSMQRYSSLLDIHGLQVAGKGRTELENQYADLKIKWKEAAKLGALTGPDVEVLMDAIKPATGFAGAKAALLGGGIEGIKGGVGKMLNNIDSDGRKEYDKLIKRNSKYKESEYVQSLAIPFLGAKEYTDKKTGKTFVRQSNGKYIEKKIICQKSTL